MWYAEQEEDYNPYEEEDFDESFTKIPQAAGTMSEDGWYDYNDNVNTIPEKVNEVEFDINQFNESMVGKATLAESSPFVIQKAK